MRSAFAFFMGYNCSLIAATDWILQRSRCHRLFFYILLLSHTSPDIIGPDIKASNFKALKIVCLYIFFFSFFIYCRMTSKKLCFLSLSSNYIFCTVSPCQTMSFAVWRTTHLSDLPSKLNKLFFVFLFPI